MQALMFDYKGTPKMAELPGLNLKKGLLNVLPMFQHGWVLFHLYYFRSFFCTVVFSIVLNTNYYHHHARKHTRTYLLISLFGHVG